MRRLSLLVFGLLLVAPLARHVRAQSAIFNVPTTDVLPAGELLVEADYITHPTSYESGGFQFFGPSLIYGVGKNMEVGLNFYYTKSSEPDAAELQPNFKWQFYNDEERSGLAAAAGAVLFVPLKNRDTANTNALVYLTFSKKIKHEKYGPRFTTGAYSFVGRMEEDETRAGVLLGYEQPLHDKLLFFADWYSGNNAFGYAASGFGVTLPKESYIYAGYSFGNQGRGNNWLGIYIGRTFK
ncbi:MAG TPA: hypothetical protein VD861_20685 [Pyrinomonadaceae bacterium]|nr:hypothetical protein [Pyrinomonadaceae bacterium]